MLNKLTQTHILKKWKGLGVQLGAIALVWHFQGLSLILKAVGVGWGIKHKERDGKEDRTNKDIPDIFLLLGKKSSYNHI